MREQYIIEKAASNVEWLRVAQKAKSMQRRREMSNCEVRQMVEVVSGLIVVCSFFKICVWAVVLRLGSSGTASEQTIGALLNEQYADG